MQNCPECNGGLELTRIDREFDDIKGYDAPVCVQGILAYRCRCGYEEISPEGQKFIDKQLQIFKLKGVVVKLQDIFDEDQKSWEILANMLGTYKQNLHKQIFQVEKISFGLLSQIAVKLERNFSDCFDYHPITFRDGKYYIDTTSPFRKV